jgi:hypothetical protein
MARHFISALLLSAGAVFAVAPPSPTLGQAKAVAARLPLRFEENRGQLDSSVRFIARSGGGNLQLTRQGPAFLVGTTPVQLTLVHSNPSPAIQALDPLPTSTNYMVGSRDHWRAGIANYGRVRYAGVYPGIDVLYYGNQNQLEYDFVLAPGSNPDAVRLHFQGDARVSLTAEGEIAIESHGARVVQKAPAIYQEGRKIGGRYTLLGRNEVGFRLQRYDRAKSLVIDPILIYSNYYGTSGTDKIVAAKMGPNGLLYLVGSSNTSFIVVTSNTYQSVDNSATGSNIFLEVIDTTANGNYSPVYITYLGGSGDDHPYDMALNSTGVAFIVGSTTSTDFPMVGNSIQTTGDASHIDSFIALVDPTQTGAAALIYSTYLGGTTGNDYISGIAIDANNIIYVIGTAQSSDFPLTDTAYAGQLYGAQDAFLAKIDITNPALIYSTYLGGELDDWGRSVALGSNGLVYFAATTDSTKFPIEGHSYQGTLKTGAIVGTVMGVMDMTQSGELSLVYSSYFGGSATDEPRKITLDSNNNIIMTGYTLSSDFPVTPDAVQSLPGGNGDAYLSILNPNANDASKFLVYSTYFGGSQGEVAYDIQPDGKGNIYLTGYTLSPDLFTTANAPQPGWANGVDLFVAAIRPGVPGHAGIVFNTYFGGAGVYVGQSLVLGSDGRIYVAGYGTLGLPAPEVGLCGATNTCGAPNWGGGSYDGFLVVMQ